MENPRGDKLAIVIGRNRRVYTRFLKKESSIRDFANRYADREREKSRAEGFEPVGMELEKPNETTFIFTIKYSEGILK